MRIGAKCAMGEPNEPSAPDEKRISREAYVELLAEASLREADEMELGFGAWCESHVPAWRQMGRDETWIRQRIESAQSTRKLHEAMKARGLTREQRRQSLRELYAQMPELYDLMIEREQADGDVTMIRGTIDDVLQRYTLRILVYEADKANYARFCRWAGRPAKEFHETAEQRVIRDLSTCEELELALAMARHLAECLDAPIRMSALAIEQSTEVFGARLRAAFIERYGYKPEQSTTPPIPVTIDGPIDPDLYRQLNDLM